MFHSTDMGDNLEEMVETEDCKVLRMRDPSGDGLMTIYRVFDGVYLIYNDFHMTHCYSRFNSSSRIFCIDHCREGRIEHRTDKDMRYYMEQGDLRMDRRVHHSGDMYFPVSHYHGITVGFFLDHAELSVREAMPGVSFDLLALADKFCGKDSIYILRKHPSIEHIFSELYNVPARIRMDYFKIKVMELLVFLRALELSEYEDERPYFYSSQTEKIKAVHEKITGDLASRFTIEELSAMYEMPATTMKKCFREVYGDSIYSYQKRYRINVAASMLIQDESIEIQKIAAAVGYENPGKFSTAFRSIMGVSPAEYRVKKQ